MRRWSFFGLSDFDVVIPLYSIRESSKNGTGRHWIWGEKEGNHQGQPKCAQCELRSFLVIGQVEKVNGVLYKLLRLVRSFLVIVEEEKIICTVWYP
jgi:hypothetical protein